MLSSNRFNSLTGIYEFVSRKSAQDILQGYLKLPFSSLSMQLPFFRGEGGGRGTQKKINQEIIANELISLTSNVVL